MEMDMWDTRVADIDPEHTCRNSSSLYSPDTNASSLEAKSGSLHLATHNYYFSFSSHSP